MMENNIAIITGAASGIGLALAKACLNDGMFVAMIDIDKPQLTHQASRLGDKAQGFVCDVTRAQEVCTLANDLFDKYKRTDLLINNAGISGPFMPVWEMSATDAKRVLDINMYGTLNCVQAFLPMMIKQQHASHLVNMASFYGLCSSSQIAPYAMSKHAIVALTESIYFDLKRLHIPIDVSVVCPSFTNTNLLINPPIDGKSQLHHRLEGLMSNGRSAEEVADFVMRDIKNKVFYILPDQEIKHQCEQRTQAIIDQTMPYEHSLEKVFSALMRTR